MTTPTAPVLVDVTFAPGFVTFVYRLQSGRLIPAVIERPAFVRPGMDMEGGPHSLQVWSRNPWTGPATEPDLDPPRCLALFTIHADTEEGLNALAKLGYGPDLRRLQPDAQPA